MNRIVTLTAVALAAAMLVPTGLAGWGSYGSGEPSTVYDKDTGLMWQGTPTLPNQVYFNVYEAYALGHTNVAPNSAQLGGRMMVVGPGSWNALLGVWVDCNKDGYIGLADGALLEYRAEASAAAGFPVHEDICPPVTDVAAHAGQIHNDGSWITELIPIAPATDGDGNRNADAMGNATNYRLLLDSKVKIWGDLRSEPRTPDSEPVATDACHQVSTIFGKGQTSHTGGVIDHVVCLESLFAPTPHALYNTAVANDPTGVVATLPDPRSLYDDNGPLDVSTLGTDQTCKSGPNGEDPGPQPCQYGSNSYVYGESDCSADPLVKVDPVSGTPLENGPADPGNFTVFAPGTPQANPQGTVAATANETFEENGLFDDCNSADDGGRDVYGIAEGNGPDSVKVTGKTSADLDFTFDGVQPRGDCNAESAGQFVDYFLFGDPSDPIPGDPQVIPGFQCGQPNDFGLPQDSTILTDDMWWAGAYYSDLLPAVGAPEVNKDTLSVQPDTFRGAYYSFYASVTMSGVKLPGGSAQYGKPFCTAGIGRNAGVQYGWQCDPDQWNLDPNTGQKTDNWAGLGNVGDLYNLRDVECYDSSLVTGSASPAGQEIGPRQLAPPLSDPAHGCR